MVHLYIFHLLYHRFGKRGLWITSSIVVGIKYFIDKNSNVHLKISKFKCYIFSIWRLPFDWRNPFGYFIAISIDLLFFWYEMMISTYILALGIGSYFFGIAMSKSIKRSLFSISQSADTKIELKVISEQFAEFIEFHSRAEQLSDLNFLHFYWFFKKKLINILNFVHYQCGLSVFGYIRRFHHDIVFVQFNNYMWFISHDPSGNCS